MQALSQRVHGNAALSVTESGKLSLVDHILKEDYTPAAASLPPKVGAMPTLPQVHCFFLQTSFLHDSQDTSSS